MGHQILVNGQFNADPHAGNFLLMPDGRIGLIDFGQFKQLTEEERLKLCRMYRYFENQDKDGLRAYAISEGYQSKYLDKDVIFQTSRFALDQDGPEVTGGLNFQQFQDAMFKKDPWTKTVDAVVMPVCQKTSNSFPETCSSSMIISFFLPLFVKCQVRASFMLRGVGLSTLHPVSCHQYWWPIAKQELHKANM